MPEQRNLILAIVLSVGIIIAFQYFYEIPRMEQAQRERQAAQQAQQQAPAETTMPDPSTAGVEGTPRPAPPGAPALEVSREAALGGERVPFDNGRIRGSIAATGGRIDDLTLSDYRISIAPGSNDVSLFNPPGAPSPYFAEFGWVPGDAEVPVPTAETVWEVQGGELAPGNPITLAWDNGEGLRFTREIAIDDNYLFTIAQTVENTGDTAVTLYPYGLISRWGTPPTLGFFILHEGPIGVLQEQLEEIDYSDLQDDGQYDYPSTGGWLGITDKYWLAALLPAQNEEMTAVFRHTLAGAQDRYQVDYLFQPLTIAPGDTGSSTNRLFAGAKEVQLLDQYGEEFGLPLFDRAVDFGWFYFITKPFFHCIHFFYVMFGNYGIAILVFTLIIKIIFFPLANKSYRAMAKMKNLQPEMVKLREKYADDRAKMNQELMGLYKKEKVNPMAGCLPILIQIPVFFALYKVLFVSIEMRHAPFFGWIDDLSAPDPTSIFNLFGILPFDPPAFLMIGVWPLLMGLTMFLQTKLNPQPADPMQARIMLFLPLMFIFLFATFPAGLVIYWTWNNVLSIGQQWAIMRMDAKAHATT